MRTLKQINAVYEKVIHSDLSERIQGIKLASLMSEMEKDSKLSEQRTEEWVALYSKLSNFRTR